MTRRGQGTPSLPPPNPSLMGTIRTGVRALAGPPMPDLIVNRRRQQGQAANQMELYSTGRLVDSASAQVLMLAEDDCVNDVEAEQLDRLGRALRDVAVDIFERVGHA